MRERELFLAALDIEEPAARQAHLRAECGDDVELLARVESLLSWHEGQSQFLNTPVMEQITDVMDSLASATIAFKGGSTRNDDPEGATFASHSPADTAKQPGDADFEIVLGYLQPSTQSDSLGRLGHYEVLEVIGQGAFGTVLRAFDEKLQRVVAIKVMAPEMAATSPARKRFLREAHASAAIRHEHVVSIYNIEETPLPYLVMEFIPGQTLQQRLDGQGPLDVLTALQFGRQIAEGLAAAHAQDLIHRDIKPANILLESGDRQMVKVTDFGLARAADDASLTQSGTIAGTPMYMAPEQAQGHKLDQRTDLFSFGSVLYQMVSGRPPFRAATTVAVLKRVTEETPRSIREIIPETPQWLCDIISKLHAKNPDERYQSAREIADLLADCEAQLKMHGRLKDFSRIPRAKRQPTRWWKWAAAAVLALLLLLSVTEFAGLTSLVRSRPVEIAKVESPAIANVETSPIATLEPSQKNSTKQFAQQVWDAVAGFQIRETEIQELPPNDHDPSAPPRAIAPFDAAQARSHQEAWAKHLGVPVEYTNSIGMKFVFIPPGEFTMGSTPEEIYEARKVPNGDDKFGLECIQSEGPQHKVILTHPFYLGVTEVTQDEYEKVTGANPSTFGPNGNYKQTVADLETTKFPVENVNWIGAAEFCSTLSELEKLKPVYFRVAVKVEPLDGSGYRLPSEAQWEFACRAGTTSKYWSGETEEDLNRVGWVNANAGNRTHLVGELPANPFGLHDMHGNVWEWVQDSWDLNDYSKTGAKPTINPSRPFASMSPLVVRGGDWNDAPTLCQSSTRYARSPQERRSSIGFRVLLPVEAVKATMPSSPRD